MIKYKRIQILFFLCILLLPIERIIGQNCDFTIIAVPTESTCQANGSITITLEGDLSNLSDIQYSATGPTISQPQNSNIINNLAPGKYTVTVRAFCSLDAGYEVIKRIENVVVPGSYINTTVSFNSTLSRKSYPSCNTGIIVLNVTNGSGNFTFEILSAPAGVTTGVVSTTKNNNAYTLNGENYPSGTYIVAVNDGCYINEYTFTLASISGFPAFYATNANGFLSYAYDCNKLYWCAGKNSNNNVDYNRYVNDGMYEIGLATLGQTPTKWSEWTVPGNSTTNPVLVNLPDGTSYADFYASSGSTISVYARLKGCDTEYTKIDTYMYKYNFAYLGNRIISTGCDYTTAQATMFSGVSSRTIVCLPISIEIKDETGTVIFNDPAWNDVDPTTNIGVLQIDYPMGHTYYYTVRDAMGNLLYDNQHVMNSTEKTLSNSRLVTNNCDSYSYQYGADSYSTCYPITVNIIDTTTHTIVKTDILTVDQNRNTIELEYEIPYEIQAIWADGSISSSTIRQSSRVPTSYTVTSETNTECSLNMGFFRVAANGVGATYPLGSTFTLIGPDGNTMAEVTPTSSSSTVYIPSATLSLLLPGTYKIIANHGCGEPVETTFYHAGFYDVENFTYTASNSCAGLEIKPSGNVTYAGEALDKRYFRLTSGPAGYDQTIITEGGSFMLTTAGTYTLGISGNGSCIMKSISIVYDPKPLKLLVAETSAYVCVGETVGYIKVGVEGGLPPYNYEIWNADNTIKENIAPITSNGGIVYFNYGESEETYTIRIKDACSENIEYNLAPQVTMKKLSTAKIVYSPAPDACYGSDVQLECLTLGTTEYHWTGPNGFASTEQNPLLTNVQPDMSGWYKVSVTPEFCGFPVEDSIYINVNLPLTAGAVTPPQEVCHRNPIKPLSCTTSGGKGISTYKWQMSLNGTSWLSISGNSATYTPTPSTASRTIYYRVIITDACGNPVTSAPMTVTTIPCSIPINPNIRAITKFER